MLSDLARRKFQNHPVTAGEDLQLSQSVDNAWLMTVVKECIISMCVSGSYIM